MSERPIGIGCMRLSDLDEGSAAKTLRAALEAGATLLDTADVYGRDPSDAHGNERLVARVLREWSDSQGTEWGGARPTIVSKGGLVRTGGRWVPDGRASHLRGACERSRVALEVGAIDLYLLHAPDPRTSLETSVRALAGLREAGCARAIGLSNVTLRELDVARRITEIAAVEVALSPFDDEALRGGLVARCIEQGIMVLAHSPLGGPKRAAKLANDPVLASIAARHGVGAAQVVIAWLRDLHPLIVPIPGPRSPEAARALVEAARITLDDQDRAALDARFEAGARLRSPRASRRPSEDAPGDVRVLMGIQGAGKTTIARELEAHGYERLNRDELGGTLRGLAVRLDERLHGGATHVVLDNTYASRAARERVIETAWKHGVPARCTWLDTPIEIARANVVRRIVELHGRLLEPSELRAEAKKDGGVLPPMALDRFRRELEPPSTEEGFAAIDARTFSRRRREGFTRAGLFVAAEVLDFPDVRERAREARAAGAFVVAFAWTPGERARATAASAARGADVELDVCTHSAGPPICWCRPPLPGLLVLRVERERLDLASSLVIGTSAAHRTMAAAAGLAFLRA